MEGKYNIHIGKMIHNKMREQGRTAVWLAAQIPCTTNNLHKIFQKDSIDIALLWRISVILEYNFFEDIR